jgi:hypothetical protein
LLKLKQGLGSRLADKFELNFGYPRLALAHIKAMEIIPASRLAITI